MKNFAFIIHPVNNKHLFKMLGWLGPKKSLPFRLFNIPKITSKTGQTISWDCIICPLLPIQMAGLGKEFTLRRIMQSVRLAEKLGASLVTLGGLTSTLTNEGKEISEQTHVAVTSGNTFTCWLVLEYISKAANLLEINLTNSTVAILGATTDTGLGCAKILSKKVLKLNILARDIDNLEDFKRLIGNEVKTRVELFKDSNKAVEDADIIIITLSSFTASFDPMSLKPAAVVCNLAIVASIVDQIRKLRDDVLVFEGDLARAPYTDEIDSNKADKLMLKDSIYGCLAEGMLLTFEGRFENYSMGKGNITLEKIEEIGCMAKKHGFDIADFFAGDKYYTEEEIEKIKSKRYAEELSAFIETSARCH